MITPAFGLTATERVLPKLALDFTTASLDSRITFTRTTGASNPATYVNSGGVVTAATNNQPRFDYDPVTLACKGLLIEESRTNTLTYSEDFATTWSLTGATISTNVTTAPDGTATADKVIATAADAFHFVYKFPTTPTGCTVSVYMKAAEYTSGCIYLSQSGNNGAVFNLSTGVVTSVTGTGNTATISAAGNGWYRCTVTNSGTPNNIVRFGPKNGALTNFVGDGTSGIYLWGAQLEAGAFPTSYIPTTTTALTRNADVATMTGTNFSDWFNASEGTFVLYSQTPLTSTYAEYLAASNGTYQNCITMGYQSASGQLLGQMRAANVSILYNNPQGAGAGALNKQSITYKNGNNVYATNGGVRQTSTSSSVPVGMDRLNIGRSASGGSSANGWVAKIFYYNVNSIAAQVQAITK